MRRVPDWVSVGILVIAQVLLVSRLGVRVFGLTMSESVTTAACGAVIITLLAAWRKP